MSINVEALSNDELANLIENHRRRGAADRALYAEALRQRDLRRSKGLDFEKSFPIIVEAAKHRRFLSYQELADASGVNWARAHHAMSRHLGGLIEYAHRKGWPMVSAVVVNKPNLKTGAMEPETLRGFVEAAKGLGYAVDDDQAFLREQQERVFGWAEAAAAADPAAGAPEGL